MNILVTGGAGYIGRHVVHKLIARGDNVVIVDNLHGGNTRYISASQLVRADVGDARVLTKVMHGVDAVIHLAGLISVAESMVYPAVYYDANVVQLKTLLDVMTAANVPRLVFASSAAVYAGGQLLAENAPMAPGNVYGATKAAGEAMVNAYAKAHGFTAVTLRFFNVAGASERAGQDGNGHLVVNAVHAALACDPLPVYGNAMRDYVHVVDVADACVRALTVNKSVTANIATGQGHTTREVLQMVTEVTGQQVVIRDCPARAYEPIGLSGNAALARDVLNWAPAHSNLRRIVADVWRWWS